MKPYRTAIILLLGLLFSRVCFGTEDTNVIAAGEWSEPVKTESGTALRGRLLMCAYPDHRGGPTNRIDVGIYVELQEYSEFIGGELHIYCDFNKGLKCSITDEQGKEPAPVGTGFSGGAPGPLWISLPPFGSARLRANVYSGGKLRDGSWGLWFTGAGAWTIRPADTNVYHMAATFTVAPPANTNSFDARQIWRGTISLPIMKIPAAKP